MTLGGTVDDRTIQNTSGKTIIGYSVHFDDTEGRGFIDQPLLTSQAEIPPGGVGYTWRHNPRAHIGKSWETVPIRVFLQAIAFGDGEVVGGPPVDQARLRQLKDEHSMADITQRFHFRRRSLMRRINAEKRRSEGRNMAPGPRLA